MKPNPTLRTAIERRTRNGGHHVVRLPLSFFINKQRDIRQVVVILLARLILRLLLPAESVEIKWLNIAPVKGRAVL